MEQKESKYQDNLLHLMSLTFHYNKLLNTPIKRQRLSDYIKKRRPNYMLFQRDTE